MPLITSIRKRGGLVVAVIAGALLMFVLSQGIQSLIPLFYGNKNIYIGEIAGKKVKLQDFDKVLNKFKSEYARNKNFSTENIHETVWGYFVRSYIEEHMFKKEYKKLGIYVPSEEMVDMVQGENIHPMIKSHFANKITNKFDKSLLLQYLKALPNGSQQQKVEWSYFENMLHSSRLKEKYVNLISKSCFVTDLDLDQEAIYDYASLNLRAIYIPYKDIPEEGIVITKEMVSKYLKKHKEKYHIDDSIDIIYVHFKIKPSEEDIEEVKIETDNLKDSFKQAKDSKSFAKNHSEGSEESTFKGMRYRDLRKIAPYLKRFGRRLVIGPILDDNVYKLYKIYRIVKTKNGFRYYVAIIDKYITPSDRTRDLLYREAEMFKKSAGNEKLFKEAVIKNNLVLEKGSQILKGHKKIRNIEKTRELVRWLFNKKNKNKVSSVFETEEGYIIALPVKYRDKGLVDLQYVDGEIRNKLINQQKARKIKRIVNLDSKKRFRHIVRKCGKKGRYVVINKVGFKDNTLGKIGEVEKAIGIAFSLKNKGDRTSFFGDKNGVIALELINKMQPKDSDRFKNKNIDIQEEVSVEARNVYEELKKKANIKYYGDNFY